MSDTPISVEELLKERDWLRRLAQRLVADSGAADDLVQETWLVALTRPPRHRRGLRGWLATVLRNKNRDARAREKSMARRAERSPVPADAREPVDIVAQAEVEQHVAQLTLALPEPYRETLLLRYRHGLAPREIAARLGEPGGTVRSRLKRGLDLLRERLDESRDGDRRQWVMGLLPIARRAPLEPGGTAMLTVWMKAALLVATLSVVGSGVAVVLPGSGAEAPPGPIAALDGPPAPPPVNAVAGEEDDAEEDEEGEGAAQLSPLDRKTSVRFDGATLAEAIDFLRTLTGVHVTIDSRVNSREGESLVTLRADDITVRAILELIALTKGLRLIERDDGSVFIAPKPGSPRPTPGRRERPWFGGSDGRFAAPPRPDEPVPAPDVHPPSVDIALPLEADRMLNPIQVTVGPEGSYYLDERGPVSEYSIWLALMDRRGAPLLVRPDAASPADRVLRIATLAAPRETILLTGAASGLLVPSGHTESASGVRISAQVLRVAADVDSPGADEIYRRLYLVWSAHPDEILHLDVLLEGGATAAHLATLLGEARRFGFVPTARTIPDRPGPATRNLAYRILVPRESPHTEEKVPDREAGRILGQRPESSAEEEPPSAPRNLLLDARLSRRNLKANGGGAKTEISVDLGLAWLAKRQAADGSWSDDAEETARVLTTFLAAGRMPGHGKHEAVVARGLAWLDEAQAKGEAATIAFAEAYALTGEERWRSAAARSAAGTRSGLALRIARLCGVRATVPHPPVSGATPAASLSRILDGETPWTSDSLSGALNALIEPVRDDPGSLATAPDDLLEHGTLAAFQAGGMAWATWNRAMKDAVVKTQVRAGEDAGSWDPRPGESRVRKTAVRVACLTVYYRYARLFHR